MVPINLWVINLNARSTDLWLAGISSQSLAQEISGETVVLGLMMETFWKDERIECMIAGLGDRQSCVHAG